jgi:hypothetical protein
MEAEPEPVAVTTTRTIRKPTGFRSGEVITLASNAGFIHFPQRVQPVGILAGLAAISHTPLVFPSLGPTAFLLYFMPLQPTASPRNTIFGHAIGIGCGYAALCLMGLVWSMLLQQFWKRSIGGA